MVARRIMKEIGEMVTGGKEETVYSAIRKMQDNNIGSIVIMNDEMTCQGIVTAHDIFSWITKKGKEALNLHLEDIMTTDLISVEETDSIIHCKRMMIKFEIEHLLVHNKENFIIGILSTPDIIRYEVEDANLKENMLQF